MYACTHTIFQGSVRLYSAEICWKLVVGDADINNWIRRKFYCVGVIEKCGLSFYGGEDRRCFGFVCVEYGDRYQSVFSMFLLYNWMFQLWFWNLIMHLSMWEMYAWLCFDSISIRAVLRLNVPVQFQWLLKWHWAWFYPSFHQYHHQQQHQSIFIRIKKKRRKKKINKFKMMPWKLHSAIEQTIDLMVK